jgi:uncharacterized tellurite resistance protein B-like protein
MMTDQEIFDELGQLGSLLGLFVQMTSIDGNTEESEIHAGIKSFRRFTDQDVVPYIEKYFALEEKLGKGRMFEYLQSSLAFFKENLSAAIRVEIMRELEEIAKSDGVIHDNEGILFHYVARELGVELK